MDTMHTISLADKNHFRGGLMQRHNLQILRLIFYFVRWVRNHFTVYNR